MCTERKREAPPGSRVRKTSCSPMCVIIFVKRRQIGFDNKRHVFTGDRQRLTKVKTTTLAPATPRMWELGGAFALYPTRDNIV